LIGFENPFVVPNHERAHTFGLSELNWSSNTTAPTPDGFPTGRAGDAFPVDGRTPSAQPETNTTIAVTAATRDTTYPHGKELRPPFVGELPL
jgi:hypothetical protein